jgi:uncharacterized membrane protein YkvA (DUF1232 family)
MRGLLGMLNVHHIVRLFLAVQGDRRVPLYLKAFCWCGLVYIFSPLDIMPELFTGVGLLDDIIVALIIMQSFLEFSPPAVLEEHCAKLGIDAEQIFISVPQTVREARSLYFFIREFGSGFREGLTGLVQEASAKQPTSGARGWSRRAPAEPAGSRYSAYRKSDGGGTD